MGDGWLVIGRRSIADPHIVVTDHLFPLVPLEES